MWKSIDGFEDRYEVDENGDIRNVKTLRILTKKIDRDGYYQIGLRKKSDRKKYWFSIHRLLGIVFLDKPIGWEELQIDHIDRNKLNNSLTNLRWVTKQDNINNRKDICWKTNTTTGELYITKYKNGYMIRINRKDLKHKSWHKTLETAIIVRDSLKVVLTPSV
jgi:hypothetical protein